MMEALHRVLDQFMGRGHAAVTVPPLDGALKPNNRLEDAAPHLTIDAPDNLVSAGSYLVFSSGSTVYRLSKTSDAPAVLYQADGPVTALAGRDDGTVAVACDGGGIVLLTETGDPTCLDRLGNRTATCVTAMAFAPDDGLVIAVGSAVHGAADWRHDLMTHGRSGSLWRATPSTGEAVCLHEGLAFPNGLCAKGDGSILVSEAWTSRILRLSPDGAVSVLLDDLPGYPARMSPAENGGVWLSVFAPRSQLIELVLREPAYRKAMMAQVEPDYWVCPALRSGVSFLEPMQGGALKQMGILKPWAPTRSYGLAIEYDADFVPLQSLHSRAGGRHHGITAAIERNGRLWLTSKGGDAVLSVDLNDAPTEALS